MIEPYIGKKWWTAQELHEVTEKLGFFGFPTTANGWRALMKKRDLAVYHVRPKQGGKHNAVEYHWDALPLLWQRIFLRQAQATLPSFRVSGTGIGGVTPYQQSVGEARMMIVEAIQDYTVKNDVSTKAAMVALVSDPAKLGVEPRTVRTANARAREGKATVSIRALYDWYNAVGTPAIFPDGPKVPADVVSEGWFPFFLECYRKSGCRSIAAAHEEMLTHPAPAVPPHTLPSYETLARRLRGVCVPELEREDRQRAAEAGQDRR